MMGILYQDTVAESDCIRPQILTRMILTQRVMIQLLIIITIAGSKNDSGSN